MSDAGWGVALLLLGALGSFSVIRDVRRGRTPGAAPRHGALNAVCLLGSTLASLAGAALLIAQP